MTDDADPREESLEAAETETAKPKGSGLETYNMVAETVGMLPSLRMKDNLIQAIIMGVITCIAVIVGGTMGGTQGALIAAVLGLLASLLISGFVLMIVGWVRAAKKMGGKK